MISEFEVSPLKPQNSTQNTLLVDKDIVNIFNSSYKTLTYCNLVSCSFIGKTSFEVISKLTSLQWLCISNNQ